MGGKVFWIASKCLETSGIERHDKMLLLDDQWLTQIQVVAPGGPSNVAKGRLNVRKFTTLPIPGGDPTVPVVILPYPGSTLANPAAPRRH